MSETTADRTKVRVCASQAQISEESWKVMKSARENAEKTIEVIDAVSNREESIRGACGKVGFEYIRFLYYLGNFAKVGGVFAGHKGCVIPKIEYTGAEHLYAKVFGVDVSIANTLMPDDAEETIEKALGTITEREAEVVRKRMSGKSLVEVGKELGVTRERIRQIEAKAMRKLRNPTRARILRAGCAELERADEEFQAEKKRIIERYLDEKRSKDAEYSEAVNGKRIDVSLERLGLSVRSYNICYRAGIRRLSDFEDYTRFYLARFPGMGRKSLEEIVGKLAEFGVVLDE